MSGATARYPRKNRLLTAAQYQRVFKHCETRAGDRHFTVLAVANRLGYARLGTAVSIRNAGNAVQRNRIKRLIKESFRQNQQDLRGYDLVVMIRPGSASMSNRQLVGKLESHWRTIAAHAHTGPVTD